MKQVLLVFTLIFTSLNPRAQEKVTITAALKGLPPGVWVYCWGSRSHPHKDSVQSVADGFNMTVIVPKGDADRYVIQMDLPTIESMALYLEKGLVRITAPGPNFKDAVVAGGQAISDYNNYLKYVKNSPKHDSLTTLWILQHPGSPASAYILSEQLLSLDEKAAIFARLTAAAKNNAPAKRIQHEIDEDQLAAIGKPAPDFSQSDTAGGVVSLRDFRGKYVLLDFWASWCGPCREENPNVVAAFNKYKDRNFAVVSISLDGSTGKKNWLRAIYKDGLNWTHLSDLQGWHNAVAVQYGVEFIPQNFLVGPDGKIMAKNLRGEDLERKLGEIFRN